MVGYYYHITFHVPPSHWLLKNVLPCKNSVLDASFFSVLYRLRLCPPTAKQPEHSVTADSRNSICARIRRDSHTTDDKMTSNKGRGYNIYIYIVSFSAFRLNSVWHFDMYAFVIWKLSIQGVDIMKKYFLLY